MELPPESTLGWVPAGWPAGPQGRGLRSVRSSDRPRGRFSAGRRRAGATPDPRALERAAGREGRFFAIIVAACWLGSVVVGFQTGLTLLVLVALLAAIAGLVRPFVGVLGVGILCTLDSLMRVYLMTGGLLRWNTFNYWLVLFILLRAPQILALRWVPLRWIFGLAALLSIELWGSSDLDYGVQHVMNLVACVGLVAYFASLKGDLCWTWFGIVNGLTAGIGGGLYFLQQDSLPYINPNAFVLTPLTALFSICLGLERQCDSPRLRVTTLVLAVVNGFWVFLTASRGGMLIGFLCLLFLATRVRRLWQLAIPLAAVAVLASFVAQRFSHDQAYAMGRVLKLFNDDKTLDDRTSGRSDIALAGWELAVRHPLGIGTGAFRTAYAEYSFRHGLHRGGDKMAAHSGWMKILAENGFPGMAIMACMVGSFAWVGWRRRRVGLLPMGLLVTAVLAAAFLSEEFQGKGLWLLSAAAMATLCGRRGGRTGGRTGTCSPQSPAGPLASEAGTTGRSHAGNPQPSPDLWRLAASTSVLSLARSDRAERNGSSTTWFRPSFGQRRASPWRASRSVSFGNNPCAISASMLLESESVAVDLSASSRFCVLPYGAGRQCCRPRISSRIPTWRRSRGRSTSRASEPCAATGATRCGRAAAAAAGWVSTGRRRSRPTLQPQSILP